MVVGLSRCGFEDSGREYSHKLSVLETGNAVLQGVQVLSIDRSKSSVNEGVSEID